MYSVRWGSKYGNKRKEYNGKIYASKKEALYAQQFNTLLRNGKLSKVESQVRIPLDVEGYHICNYIVDFKLTYPDGLIEYVEIKGFQTEVFRLKWKLFEALYGKIPNTKLTIIF